MRKAIPTIIFTILLTGTLYSADVNTTFSIVKQCFPSATKAGIMIDEKRMNTKGSISSAASANGITPIILPLKTAQNIGPGFNKFVNDFGVDMIYMPDSKFSASSRTRSFLSKKCGVKKVALIVESREFVEAGALLCVEDQGGTPVIVVNQKTAGIIGFTPPASLKVEMVGN